MTTLVQRKPPQQQYNNIYHFALIKIVVLHQLGLLKISWEDFFTHEVFTGPQVPSTVFHEAGEPSHQQEIHETQTTSVLVFVTYQKGTRRLFEAAKRVLSPPGVEGVSFPPLAEQVQDKGKKPLHDEGPSRVPMGERETQFVLLHDDDTDREPTKEEFREIIQEQQVEIEILSLTWRGPSGT